MMTLLAAMDGHALVQAVIVLIVFGIIIAVLAWGIRQLPLPEPFPMVANAILVLVIVLLLVNFLLSLIGRPLVTW